MDPQASAKILQAALANGLIEEERLDEILASCQNVKSYDLIDKLVVQGYLHEEKSDQLLDLLGEQETSEVSQDGTELELAQKLAEFADNVSKVGRSGETGQVTAAALKDPKSDLVGRKIGDYEIVGQIARGGMGAVFRAKPLGMLDVMVKGWGLPEIVALKVMLVSEGQQQGDDVKRFRDEVKALINLDHPNIIKVFDFGQQAGLWFYAMQLIEGEDVRCLFDEGKPPPVGMALALLRDVVAAMSQVHKAGILHRDIKPSNLLLDKSCHPYRPVLIDFGLIAGDNSEEGENLILGTPNYMPPEQANPRAGVRVGRYSDVYALGATLYFLLTGKPPFTGWTARGIIKKVIEEDPEPPSRLRQQIPTEVEELCLKCLAKLPKDRFRTCDALLDAIDLYLKRQRRRLKWRNFTLKVRRFFFGKA